MKVSGMRCSVSCSPKAVDALKSVDGVESASVSFEEQTASVEAKGKTCTTEGHKPLIDALDKVGYEGKVTATRKKTS
ncbi:MAG: cation transporter, partial [Myxococcota bacterium]|nr:cation transporter [Myxococcota bacterium]